LAAAHKLNLKVVDKDGGNWIKSSLPQSSESRTERKAKLKLSDTGELEGKLTVTYTGLEAMYHRLDVQHADAVERKKFLERQSEVVAISVDHIMNATAWEREIGPFDFLLCSDFWPHGEVSGKYGVLQPSGPLEGASERAIFVVDKTGKIAFSRVYPTDQMPGLDETLEALRRS